MPVAPTNSPAARSDDADVLKAQRWCARMAAHRDTPKECRCDVAVPF